MAGGGFVAAKKQSQRSSSTRPDSIIVPGYRTPNIQPEAGSLSRLAGLEALGTVAPEENYRDPGSAARPELPYSGGDRSSYRRGAWFRLIAGVALLAGLALLAVLTGQLHVRQFLSYVSQSVVSLTMPAVFGLIIAIAMIGVVVGCVLYRVTTRYRRLTPDAPWGSFEESALVHGPPSLPCSRSGTFRGRVVISLIILVVVTALTITTLFSWHGLLSIPVVLSYWLLANGTLLFEFYGELHCGRISARSHRPGNLVISAIMRVTRRREKGKSQS